MLVRFSTTHSVHRGDQSSALSLTKEEVGGKRSRPLTFALNIYLEWNSAYFSSLPLHSIAAPSLLIRSLAC